MSGNKDLSSGNLAPESCTRLFCYMTSQKNKKETLPETEGGFLSSENKT